MPEEVLQTEEVTRSPRWRILAVLSALLIAAGAGLWLWLSHGSEAPAEAANATPVRSTLHLETFVLNLADPEQRAYLRVGIDLGVNQDLKQVEGTVSTAQVRDAILGVLAEAKAEDLLTSAGKNKLKQDLLRALKERVPQLGVEEVYFTEFLIQR